MEIKNNNYINFKAGLNNVLLLKEKLISASATEKRLYNNYGIVADFAGNKSMALANSICADIFTQLSEMIKVDIPAPPFITVYKKNQLINKDAYIDFCLIDDAFMLQGKNLYPSGSVFLRNYRNLKQLDNMTEAMYKNNQISSNHFLAPVIHEWLHNIHLNILKSKSGTHAENNHADKFLEKVLSDRDCEIVSKEIGQYSANNKNQYFEVFSEFFTQLICQSLSKNSRKLIYNPIDLMKNKSKDLQKIIENIINE